MSTKLSPYTPPPPLRSALIKNATEAIPPIDELEQLQSELRLLQQRTRERVKKASEDLKNIEESMRRMKEKEKGKARAIEKVKRERDYTPIPDADELRSMNTPYGVSSKARATPIPAAPYPASLPRSSVDPRRQAAEDIKKKKKKRKREDEESDAESEFARPRKTTPPIGSHPPAQKASKPTPLSQPTKLAAGPDFTVPHTSSYQSLYVARPPTPTPPIPGPSKPTDVMDDFSKLKMPPQVLVGSFYASIEPWLRPIREEDIGFLEYTGDEVEPFIMPKLGRHYLDVWEGEDSGIVPPLMGQQDALAEQFTAPTPKWDPSTLMESDLLVEEKGHGPLTERVISALLPVPDVAVWKGVKAAEDAMEGRPGGSGAAAARKERLNVSELENRIKDTMRYHGLLDGMPDFADKVDDPIATALRHAQRELRTVAAINKARRARLAAIARDHLAYQEYLELRDSIDKNIWTLFGKLQKKDGPKIGRKKKKIVGAAAAAQAAHAAAVAAQMQSSVGSAEGSGSNNVTGGSTGSAAGAEAHLPLPAALGLGPDEENRLVVNEQLKHLVETRRQWVNTVGKFFEEKQRANPGRIWGLPTESAFKDIEDDVRRNLEGIEKGVREEEEKRQRARAEAAVMSATMMEVDIIAKEKGREDEMDVG